MVTMCFGMFSINILIPQKDNKLKDTSGVVGKETLTLLIKQFEDAG